MKKHLSFFFIFTFCTQFTHAKVIIPHHQVPEQRLSQALSDSSSTSYADYFLQNTINEVAEKKLVRLFERAQRHFFAESYEMAQGYYLKITDQALEQDWSPIVQKIIHQSFKQLAKLPSQNPEVWSQRAQHFTHANVTTNSITWDLSPYQKNFHYLLLNGKVYNLESTLELQLTPGRYRVTLVSNRYLHHTFKGHLRQILLLDPPLIPLLEGTCHQPYVQMSGFSKENMRLVFNQDCSQKTSLPLSPQDISSMELPKPIQPEAKSILQKPLFWGLLGGAALGLMLIQKNKNTSQPPLAPAIPPTIIE